MTKPIRILIVDDQTLVREGFRKLLELEAGFEVVGTAGDGEAALALTERLHAEQTPPDVVLMDLRMPRMDGITATSLFKERWPSSRIVILTTFDDVELIHAGLHAGALGYLLKDVTSEQLATTVRMAAQGQMLLQPNIASKAFATLPTNAPARPLRPQTSSPTRSPSSTPIEQLTEREREILNLVAQGASNRQVGEALFITEGTA